jgi:hypothetical protein
MNSAQSFTDRVHTPLDILIVTHSDRILNHVARGVLLQSGVIYTHVSIKIHYTDSHILYGNERNLLLSNGQSFWLNIQRSGFDSRRYQAFWEVVGLERGPLSLMSTTEELTELYV